MQQHPLKIEIERVMKEPFETDFDLTPEQLELLDDPEFEFPQSVTGKMVARLVGDDNILITGQMATRAISQCVRCLHPMEIDLVVDFQFAFLPQRDERPRDDDPDDDEKLYYDRIVYPTEKLREELMLALPYLPKCELSADNICPVRNERVESMLTTSTPGLEKEAAEEKPTSPWKDQIAALRKQLESDGKD